METKQKFYIIGNYVYRDGLFSIYKHVCSHILFAVENGYLPVVDLKHYPNQYFKDGREYKDNAWDYYFKQPAGITLDDIDDSADVIIPDVKRWSRIKYRIYPFDIPLKKTTNVNSRINDYNKYLKFSDDMLKHTNEIYKELFQNEKEVLGIIIRGSDYAKLKPQGHLIQPKAKDVIKKAKILLNKLNYKKIYLATEDAKIYEKFKKEFGDMILDNNQYRYGNNYDKKHFLYEIKVDRKDHAYNLAKEYLASLYILSRCKYLIGGQTSGTKIVAILSNGFEYGYIWTLGIYDKGRFPMISRYFFIQNEYSNGGKTKHKIITILGLKFKIKVKG